MARVNKIIGERELRELEVLTQTFKELRVAAIALAGDNPPDRILEKIAGPYRVCSERIAEIVGWEQD